MLTPRKIPITTNIRRYLELVGLLVLALLLYSQMSVIKDAVRLISDANLFKIFLLFGIYWIILPLTATSIAILYPKNKKPNFLKTNLALLAGSGPGKIIPAGAGTMAIISVYLKKIGLSYKQAIGVALTNNLIGMISSSLLLLTVLIIKPSLFRIVTDNIPTNQAILSVLLLGLAIVAILVGYRAKSINKVLRESLKAWIKIAKGAIVRPQKFVVLLLIAISITLIFTLSLFLSARAININIAPSDAFLALTFGVTVGGLAPTPGGVGGIEAGIIVTLLALGYSSVEATSITILFRTATYIQPLLPGTLSYFYLKKLSLL